MSRILKTPILSTQEEWEYAKLSALKPNEREILTLHYGLGNQEEHSFEQIGVMKGRSRARMQQIEKKAFVYLRQKLEHYIS